MNEQDTYRFEDIEALLMSKRFDELLDEERSFILQHVQDAAEYASMRDMLLQMHELSFSNDMQEPPEALHTALLHGFAEHAERERGFRPRFAPWMGWAIAATVVGFVVIFFAPMWKSTETAQVEQATPPPAPIQQTTPDTASVVIPSDAEKLYAALPEAAIPTAPEPVEDIYNYEETVKTVILTAQEEEEFEAPAEMDSQSESPDSQMEDVALSKESAAPQMAQEKKASTLAEAESISVTKAERTTTATSKNLIAPKKKRRNPDVRKLSQTQQLMKLLRPEGSAQ
jgi:hypothetical protein